MLDLPLRGEDKRAESQLDSPSGEAETPPPAAARSMDQRGRGRKNEPKRQLWPLFLLLLLIVGVAGFSFYRYTTPVAGFSIAALDFDGQLVGGTSDPMSVTVTNHGTRAMSLTGVRLRGEAAAEFEVVADGCTGSTRGAGESCTLEVAFKPAVNGGRAATLDLIGNAIGELPLTGSGAAPVLVANHSQIDFGPQPVDGRSASRTLRLSNNGAAPMSIGSVSLGGSHSADFALSDKCGSGTLGPGGECTVRINFTPRAAGERAGELRVESDGAGQPTTIALSGSGVWSGQPLDATPAEIDFGSQRRNRASEPQRIAFINRTSESVAVGDVRLDGESTGVAIDRQDCVGATLAAGEECVVELRFTPVNEGRATALVAVRTAAGLETSVEVSGKGVEPRLTLEKTELDFGELRVGFEKRRRAVLTNSGTSRLAFADAALAGSAAASYSLSRDGCSGFTLDPGKTCTIELLFKPVAGGAQRAELRIESDAAGGRQAISLDGRGTSATLALDQQRMDFGSVQRPGAADRTLTLRNSGSARMQVRRVSVTGGAAADFVVSSIGCGENGLAGGASCRVTVRFVPRADGARAARLVIQHDAGPAKEVSLLGTALPAKPGFRISDRSIDFGTRQVGTRSSVRTVTVSNSGDGRLVLRAIAIEGAQSGDFTIVPGTCDGAPYVAPRGSCSIGVRFTPRSNGSHRATLSIRHNAGGDGSVSLVGLGSGG